MLEPYEELVKIDVLPFCEKRKAKDDNGNTIEVPYLNWAKCKELLHKHGAKVVYYEPVLNEKGHSLFMSEVPFINDKNQTNHCFEVRVRVVIDDQEYMMHYPLLNGTYIVRNDTINQLRISNAQARAFVKCVAIHTGLGFNLWVKDSEPPEADEDLGFHNILMIKKRVEQLITLKIQHGMDMKDIFAELGINQKQFDTLMNSYNKLASFEQKLKQL